MDSKSTRFQADSSTLLEDAELALENLNRQEICLLKETEELFKKQVDHIKCINDLQSYIPNIQNIDEDSKRLSNLVDSTSSLVEDVCGKIRRIDLAKARLEDCLSKVRDILDLKTCRDGLNQAMEANNFEEAAIHIKRYLSIDQKELAKTIDIICKQQTTPQSSKPQPLIDMNSDESTEINAIDPRFANMALGELQEAQSRLLKICQQNLSKAIKEDNTRDIERFFKIFPMINEHQDGLTRYAEHLRTKIVNPHVEETLKSKQINQADKLAALYESIAKLIDSHQALIETYYGPGHLIVVIKVLQKECDLLSRKILEEFRNVTNLQQVAKVVRRSTIPTPSQFTQNPSQPVNLNASKMDPRDVDNILNEITLIISRSEVYLNFIVQRIKDDMQSTDDGEAQRQANLLKLYNLVCIECELNHLVQEVGGIYVLLEQFYLNESSKKAILMDQIDVESSSCFMSSMLDDIFFINKKCTERAISTKSTEVFCAIINHCVTLLESTFCQVLENRLVNQQYYSTTFTGKNLDLSQAYTAIQSGRYLQSASELEVARAQYFSSLNNLDKACDYIKSLRAILDVDNKKLKPSLLVIEQKQDNQIEKSITCLNELSSLVHRFSSIVNSSLYQLFNVSLRNKLKVKLSTIISEDQDLPTVITNSPDQLTSLAKNLLISMDKSLSVSLTAENYAKLVNITKDFLSSSLKSM